MDTLGPTAHSLKNTMPSHKMSAHSKHSHVSVLFSLIARSAVSFPHLLF